MILQAGLLIYIDDSHWVKAGIEFCDGKPRLSVVVCNVFSDWSTQPWSSNSAKLKVHKINQSSSLVVEACEIGSEKFQFVRIAHLSALAVHKSLDGDDLTALEKNGSNEEQNWRIGPFSACPMEQKGCQAIFHNFRITDREAGEHSADASVMVNK